MSLLRPRPLKQGDKVALVAPSSPAVEYVEKSIESIKYLGLEPVIYKSCISTHGYLAGKDSLRANDIMKAFQDPEIKGVFCLRGGYGALRLLPLLDYTLIRKNPKCFVGYSDITALHTAINSKCGIVTYHAPMPTTGYAEKDSYTVEYLKRCIFSLKPFGKIYNPDGYHFNSLVSGKAKGRITGGNLSLLAASLGTPFEIDTKGKILFIEEVDKKPYDIDMSLTSLALAGKFSDAEGIVLGKFERCEETKEFPSLEINDIIREVVIPYGKPVLSGLHAGHTYPQPSLPLGIDVILDTDKKYIEII